jgi:multiple sugar transport system ATP-binding protein
MIAGLEEVTSGDIFVGDKRVNDLEPGDRDIAMVFQNYALYPHMTVRQNMSFGLQMRKTPKSEIQRQVAKAAQILSIESLLDRRPKELSGGQRQRVAVGRAIVREPKAFLFDEPLSNLDAKLRVQMRTELARLHHRLKTTTVYVTHDQVEAMTLGDRIVVMKDGVIQQIDTPMNVYQQPTNRFVAGFIGSPAMNFVDGQIVNGQFAACGVDYPLPEPGNGNATTNAFPDCGTLGFRPENLTTDVSHPKLTDATLEVVEHMGHETIVYFTLSDNSLVARLNGKADVRPGDQLPLHLPIQDCHLFAPENQGAVRIL